MAVSDMKIADKLNLKSSLHLNFMLLSLLGNWLPENLQRFQCLYKIYAVLLTGIVFVFYVISELVYIALAVGDLERFTDGSFLLLTHVAQVFKLYYFTKNHKRIRDLANGLNRDVFQPRNKQQREMINVSMRNARNFYLMFLSMSIWTVLLWGAFPLIDNSEGGMQLPLSAWYPLSTEVSPNFEIIYAYQILAVLMDAAANVSMDTTASAFMAHICGQLNVLNDSLQFIREQSIKNLMEQHQIHSIHHRIKSKYIEAAVKDNLPEEMEKELIRCIIHHNNIIEMSREVGYIFNVSVLSQFAAGCIIICLTMFQLTLVSVFSLQFVSMVLYQGCMLMEIILYCWYGNQIILKSSRLGDSAYFSDWADASVSYKRNLLLIMVRSQQPIKLYAGNLFTLSLETFMAILRSSWSYFAVLHQHAAD